MNIVVVDGRLINDPAARKVDLQNGSTTVVSFAIINENGKNKSLFSCEAWGPKGKDVMKFKSGDTVCVSGVLNQQSWDDKKTGEKKSIVKVRANQVVQATLPSDVQETDSTRPGYGAAQSSNAPRNPAYASAPAARRETAPFPDQDDNGPGPQVFDDVDF